MRAENQIRRQLKQVIYRHLQKRLRANFKQRPDTCSYNRQVVLDEAGSHVHLCGVLQPDGTPRNTPCDSRIPGCDDMAKDCPLWAPLLTKDEVKEEFFAIVQSGDRGVIAANYPDVAALLWVLDDPQGSSVPTPDEIEQVDPEPEPPGGFFASIRKRLGGGGG